MYDNKFFYTGKNLTEQELRSFEQKFNIVMPKNIKEYYLTYNGGLPEKDLFKQNEKCTFFVNYFLPIMSPDGLSVEKVLFLLNDEKTFPSWLIPFANDESGNFFCYSLRKQDNGAIYYYNHEFEYGESPEDHITFLTDSVLKFINGLQAGDIN